MELRETGAKPVDETNRAIFFSPGDTLKRTDCNRFYDKDSGNRITTPEGTFKYVGIVWGQIDRKNPPKFLDLLVTVDKSGMSKEYFLRDDGERTQPQRPEETDEPYSRRTRPGTPKLIPVNFQES